MTIDNNYICYYLLSINCIKALFSYCKMYKHHLSFFRNEFLTLQMRNMHTCIKLFMITHKIQQWQYQDLDPMHIDTRVLLILYCQTFGTMMPLAGPFYQNEVSKKQFKAVRNFLRVHEMLSLLSLPHIPLKTARIEGFLKIYFCFSSGTNHI